ncbi:Glycosyltransferase, GT2 family [Loktanella salsilacus]|uniref:Glycosyltransferase, GT2 family n=1 Tax=Loktanella salsilacus TaxID=195913 RepID=A0A1I4JEW2_9RHOB|nr:glycosyltransferase [Loktanella salsilacus]SFL64753.1 Glycosyltransferase, GT2 family [Loktanella salsilacus]
MTRHIFQQLMLPDPDLPNAPDVFVRLSQGAALKDGNVTLPASGAQLQVDTYANLFNLGTWAAHAPVTDLALELAGTGPVSLHLWQVTQKGEQTLIQTDVTLTQGGNRLPITPAAPDGLLMWSLTARGPAHLNSAAITARAPVAAPIKLAIVITTFGREDAVRATATRIAAFLGAGQLPHAHLFVIDNGRSVTLPDHPDVTLIPNRNLGGAGGFARGLAAARGAGSFSHVLFMDDDAAFQMENLTRTAAFLRHAADPATALAGAMVSAVRPHELWENGATFDQVARSRFKGTDLRNADEVTAMELATPETPDIGFYGAWWYFAFPIAAVRHDPFPFFVRGDDVWFGLSNPFRIATLNGVMSLQDDFSAKSSPQTAYLDMRYILVVNMTRPTRGRGPFGIIALAMRQILYCASHLHYEAASAQLTAWQDVLDGPDFFARNIDMADKRSQIAALTQTERWGPLPADLPPQAPKVPMTTARKIVQRLTLNGHLLPGARWWGRDVTIPLQDRSSLWCLRYAKRGVFLDDAGRAYTVTHSKLTFARLMGRSLRLALRFLIAWPRLSRDYRAAMNTMTTPAFWKDQFAVFPDKR